MADKKNLETVLAGEDQTEFIAKILATIPDIVYVYDIPKQSNIWSNRQIDRQIGYTPEEVKAMGDNFFPTVLHPEDLARLPEIFAGWEYVEDGVFKEIEYRMRHKDGDYRWFLARDCVFKRDKNGRTTQLIGATWNITARKDEEQRRIKLQKTLLQNQKMETLGVLSSMLAHEIKNPIFSILGFSSIITDKYKDDPELIELAQKIKGAGERIDKLSNRMLKFVKPEKIVESNVSVSDALNSTLDLIYPVINSKSVQIISHIEHGLPTAKIESIKIQQILTNLITNSIHALEEANIDSPHINIEARLNKRKIYIAVSDNGPGVPPEHISEIFEPFYTTKSHSQGTGLGLAICNNILEEIGSKLKYSDNNPGARFSMEIPIY